ncbi:hypothetical protein KR018_011017, partial [Drosophila ironensis]
SQAMDLWTSMFSDFEEPEGAGEEDGAGGGVALEGGNGEMEGEGDGEGEEEAEVEGEEEYDNGNGNSDILDAEIGGGDDDILDRAEGDEEDEEEEGDDAEEDEEQEQPEPDDDAIFDFELQPLVSIAEPPPPPLTGSATIQRHDGSDSSQSMGGVVRPTASQINATDENGVPINYELGVVYICPACGAEFRQQDHWKRHMNQMHRYNTLRGLNFCPVDKLYQRCQECHKRIAMHSRENLLKHKFTHLPFRCTKCFICKREYKYRQDLMVHLRMVHSEEVVSMMKEGYNAAGRKTRVRETRLQQEQREISFVNDMEDLDRIEVRNELLEPDADESVAQQAPPQPPEDGKARALKKKQASGVRGDFNKAAELCQDYIHFMCPDCGTECETYGQWSQHIEFVHDYVSRRGLNFRSVDMQMQCLECKKTVTPNTIKSLRAHKFSHLANPEWLHCKLCYKGFTDHSEVVSHLLKHHHMESLMPEGLDETALGGPAEEDFEEVGRKQHQNGVALDEESPYFEDSPRRGGRISSDDMYEPFIDYLCPQCGKEFPEKKHWRTHVVMAHGMNDLSKLNFDVINDRQLKCNECDKIITNAYGIQNAQQHRITHLPFKAYARCIKCHKSYTDRKGLVKHLATYHSLTYVPRKSGAGNGEESSPQSAQKQPRKQIVTIANETYEIIYLDDQEPTVEDENDFGEQMQAEEEEYQQPPATPPSPPMRAPASSRRDTHRYKCVHCGEIFGTQVAVRQHINEKHFKIRRRLRSQPPLPVPSSDTFAPMPTVEQNFIFLCPSCGTEYKTQFEWRRHINEVHNFDKRQHLNMRQLDKYRFQCTQCKDIVTNSKLKGLQDHHFRHLPYRLYLKCLICGTCYNHKPNIAAHLKARHNVIERDLPLVASKQQKQVHNRFRDKDRDKPRHSSPAALALSPPSCSSSSAGAAMGRSLKPPPGGLPSRPAGLNTLEDSISYHNAVDLDFITYFCPKCNQNFDSHAFWRKHTVEQHNFNSREGLNFRQLDNHHYLCLECYKRVTVTHSKGAIGQLQSHKFRHLPYRSFKCLTCGGEFVRKQMFFKHLNRKTNRCDNIPQRAVDEEDPEGEDEQDPEASSQMRITFQLDCPQCGEGFTTGNRRAWREHINGYHSLANLQLLHMMKTGEDLYSCHDCGEEIKTTRLGGLQQHRFQHLPYPAYVRCKLCQEVGDCPKDGRLHSLQELEQHILDDHATATERDAVLAKLREHMRRDEQEDTAPTADGDDIQPGIDSGPYMPLPPHLLDDGEDMDFEDQYLLG